MFTLNQKLWLTADKSQVVEDGDHRAAFLLGGVGHQISDDEATRLGLKGRQPQPNKAEQPPENKGVSFPPENKRTGKPKTSR